MPAFHLKGAGRKKKVEEERRLGGVRDGGTIHAIPPLTRGKTVNAGEKKVAGLFLRMAALCLSFGAPHTQKTPTKTKKNQQKKNPKPPKTTPKKKNTPPKKKKKHTTPTPPTQKPPNPASPRAIRRGREKTIGRRVQRRRRHPFNMKPFREIVRERRVTPSGEQGVF